MKRLFLLVALLIASSFPALAHPAKNDYQNINLVDTLEASGNFKTLLSALHSTGLIDTLKGAGPFTIFAPNDEAFAKLPSGVLDALMEDPVKLRALLLYHVTVGKFTVSDLQSGTNRSITMMNNTQAETQDNGFSWARPQAQHIILDKALGPSEARENDRLSSAKPDSKPKLPCDECVSAPPIVINKSANVVMADLSASNGVIHVIDAVLMPTAP